jgi:signal transduction histidine kinase
MKPTLMPAGDFVRLLKLAPGLDEPLPSDLDFSFVLAYIDSGNSDMKDLFQERRCVPGELIIQEDEEGKEIFIIRSGRVVIFKGEYQAPVILGFRGAGDMIGEMAVLENRPRSASVVALDAVELLATDRDGFDRILNRPPFLGMNMLGMLSHRLREIGETHSAGAEVTRSLSSQVAELESEKRHWEELERLRQETTDLIVHDLRNPLSSILGAIKVLALLLPNAISNESRELLEIILSSTERMQRLVDSMLEVSRMQAGDYELNLTSLDLGLLVTTVSNRVLRPYSHDIDYTVQISPDLPKIQADQHRLERVVANLLDNAVKHSPKPGKIHIAVLQIGNSLQVSINDEGPGIPAEERERIFERFAQVAGEKNKRRGFGLGLNFCKLTITAHGGLIWVEPGPSGIGSTFNFRLPILENKP